MVEFIKNILSGPNSNNFRKKKRLLHERSFLTLEFPQTDDRAIKTYIPFLENPQISEKGQARLNRYDLVGRAGQLFSYAGAQSRKLTLTFNISLLHVIDTDATEGISERFKSQFKVFFSEKQSALKAFNMASEAKAQAAVDASLDATFGGQQSWMGGELGGGFGIAASSKQKAQDLKGESDDNPVLGATQHRNYYRTLISQVTGQALEDVENSSILAGIRKDLEITSLSQGYKEIDNAIDLVFIWLNLIRGSVLNNSRNTLLGPPIARLNHGNMYNNVPCLVEDYSIKILEDSGYEVQTLTPKRIEVTLNLVEARTGNFGEYSPGQQVQGDNLTGWESIIDSNDIDPCNGVIGNNGLVGGNV